jgi:hypothetical protein
MFFFNFFFLAKSTVYTKRKYPKKIELFFRLGFDGNFKNPFFSPPIFSAADFSKALRLLLMTILLLNHAHISKTPQQVSDGVMGNFFQKNSY